MQMDGIRVKMHSRFQSGASIESFSAIRNWPPGRNLRNVSASFRRPGGVLLRKPALVRLGPSLKSTAVLLAGEGGVLVENPLL